MARPIKEGLSYFPWDVRALREEPMESLIDRFGPFGALTYIAVISYIYEEGYYLEVEVDRLAKRLYTILGPKWIRVDKIRKIIIGCVELGLFDEALFRSNVITSKSIQKQYILSTQRRKVRNIKKYWLLDEKEMSTLGLSLSMPENEGKTTETGVNVDNNSVNDDTNTQSKSKKKRKKDKLINLDKSIYGVPKMHYLTKLIIERKYINEIDENIIRYNNLFELMIETYGYECVLSGVNYLIKYSRNPEPPIDDKFSFMKASLENNLERLNKDIGGESIESYFTKLLESVGKGN